MRLTGLSLALARLLLTQPLLAAVAWMAARADRLLLDVLGDPAAKKPQRAQALSLQASLQSWLPHIAAELNEAAGCR